MRKLPLLLVLLLLVVFLAAATAQASPLSGTPQPLPVFLAEPEEEDEAEEEEADEESEDPAEEAEIEREICEEDPELCEEESNGKGKREADPCLLKKASATVTANPGKSRLRLTVRYKTLKPATVDVEASLRGSKGVLFLGNEHSRFRRSGVYRDTFQLSEKKMKKALAARDFEVELQVVNTPPSCQIELKAHRDGAKKLIWS